MYVHVPLLCFGLADPLFEPLAWRPVLTVVQNESLPQLQSVVIVLMKTFLYNITAYSTMQQAQANGMANFRMAQQPPNLFRSHDSANGLNGMAGSDNVDMSLEDLDATRAREIESKALTGILLLLLKWFKLSRT